MPFNRTNLILREIEPDIALRCGKLFERSTVARGTTLQAAGEPVEWVWFPENALVSTSSETLDGESVSGGMVGREGVFGAIEACGSRVSFSRTIVQIAGECLRIRSEQYRELFEASPKLRTAIHKHMEALLVEARQTVACIALHPVQSRLCRVLLEAADRSPPGHQLSLTQEGMAAMLGVQRSTIAAAYAALQRAGLIHTSRGSIEIVDADGLEAAACSCRQIIAEAQQEIAASTSQVCGS